MELFNEIKECYIFRGKLKSCSLSRHSAVWMCVLCVIDCYCGSYNVKTELRNGGFVSDGICYYVDFTCVYL